MTTSHTPGRLRYGYEPGYCGELIASDGRVVCHFDTEPSKEDARRLVACWNRLEKFSTDDIENPAVDLTGHGALLAENIWLKSRNDELLEALEDFSEYVRNEQASTDGAVVYSNTQINRLVFKARTAIAKAEGKA